MLKKFWLPILLGTMSPNVFASEAPQPSGYAKGFWLGIGSGVVIRENSPELANENHYGPTGKIEFGYQFHDNASLYSSYDYMDVVSENKIHIGVLGLKANYFLTDNLSAFANVGMSHYLADDHNELHESYSYGGVVGAGLEYTISKRFATKVGYNYYDNIKLASGNDTHLHQVYLGIAYKFGQQDQIAVQEVIVPQIEYIEKIKTEEVVQLVRTNYVITFPLGQSRVVHNSAAEFHLQEVAELMKTMPELKAELTGRADKTGGYAINERISAERAKNIYHYLVSQDIDPERLFWSAVSYHNPITEGNNAVERSVEIQLK
ncbi:MULTISPECIES: OmpA family protein [Vibrio]|uniref:OmpA family protein n=1 Tax=Vibrio TaxID=662 RepID=UPI001482693C|nr:MULTISPECIES: OmpA family protein [Vibrio]MDQ2164976.1 OmpA family protein [Vibrio anguillarum]MDQ2189843.1 OmpA family protein [Vibrio sp. A14(2019)]MDQ2198020.1 OmpA family protein [Vibrio sp. 2017_1457_11]NNN77097.1 OmpA family protein [Vibrio sp. B7]NNN93919.1 OmpA family protein [Vibrio sp. B8-1]